MNKVPSGERDAKFEEFLIDELEQLSEAFLRNEEDGEKRVTFLITLAGGVGAALAFLHNHERWPQQGRGDFFVFEAAGAGQAGARFAAVAGQIRQLSDLAPQAAKDVGTLVHAVQL